MSPAVAPNLPATQERQRLAATLGPYCPAGQLVQTVVEEAYWPSRHAVHLTEPVAGAMVPSGQVRQLMDACAPWYVPLAQSVHLAAEPVE